MVGLESLASTSQGVRYLRAGSKLHLSSSAQIAWYCLLVSVVAPIVFCLGWCWYQRYTSHRRAMRALERENELDQMSRMERNIQAFSAKEKSKRTRMVRAALKDQLCKITKADLAEKERGMVRGGHDNNKIVEGQDDEDSATTASEDGYACSVCLEAFRVGDSVAHSSNSGCRHVFHEECIVSWLVAKRHAFCPYCRRPFLCLPIKTSQTSVTSHDQLSSTAFDDTESSSRPEPSVIAALDERTIAEALAVVMEDELPNDTPATVVEETECAVDTEEL